MIELDSTLIQDSVHLEPRGEVKFVRKCTSIRLWKGEGQYTIPLHSVH